MRVERIGHDQARVEYHHGGEYVRRVVDLGALTEFLTGSALRESNLGPKGEAMNFADFAENLYLPKDARRRLADGSYTREIAAVRALNRYFGHTLLHEITREGWDIFQADRLSGKLAVRGPCSPGGVLKEFKCLRKVLAYALDLGFIRVNVLATVKPGQIGLFDDNRADIWFTKAEVERLFPLIPEHLRDIYEFRLWTGARPEEAAQFGQANVHWGTGKIWVVTLKKRRRNGGGQRRRYFTIRSLGPRFEEMLRRLKADPRSGLFFVNPEDGQPYCERYLQEVFRRAVERAGIVKRLVPRPYDLRGTFATHRAMVVNSFRQLQAELGHASPRSIQNYLDEAAHLNPEESIFHGVAVSENGPA